MNTDNTAAPGAQQVQANPQDVGQNAPSDAAQKEAQTEQAAQLSDKRPAIGAPAGGTKSPAPPGEEIRRERRASTSMARKVHRKKKSNQFDFRSDEDTTERIFERVELAGCNPSEAIRQLIEDGATLATRITIAPHAPPQQLEAFIGELKAWRHEFQAVRSRLNAPMPQNPEDNELVERVRKWRATAEELHAKIRKLLAAAQAALSIITSLTPEKLAQLRLVRVVLRRWTKEREDRAAKAEKQEERESHLKWANNYRMIITLIDDMGIAEEEE